MYLRTALTVVAAALIMSCATGEGRLFESVVEAESAGDTAAGDTDDQDVAEQPTLTVESRPDGADVFLNGEYIEQTPATVEELAPGTYRLEVTLSGHYDYERWITIETGQSYVFSVTLEAITGFLAVTTSVQDATVTVRGTELETDVLELPIGDYTVRAQAFGYEAASARVTIRENETTSVHLTLDPAKFDVRGVAVSRRRFAPQNPGILGQTALVFSVTAPGTAEVTVLAPGDSPVRSAVLGPFTGPSQRWVWDGTDETGTVVPDGEYRVRLVAKSDWTGLPVEVEVERRVAVDSSAVIRHYGSLGTTVGTLYATAPGVLPPGSIQLTAGLMGHRQATSFGVVGRYPFWTTLRIGLPSGLEAVAAGTAILYDEISYTRTIGGVSLRYRFMENPLEGAVALRGTLHNRTAGGALSAPDSLAEYIGGGLLVPLSYRVGNLEIVVTPELAASPVPVTYDGEAAAVGFYLWSYLRAGVRYDVGTFQLGLSGATRTLPFSQGLGLDLPFQLGAEAHVLLPGTPLYVSATVAAEVAGSSDYYLMGGGALGIVY